MDRYIPVLGEKQDFYKCISRLAWGRDAMVTDPATPLEFHVVANGNCVMEHENCTRNVLFVLRLFLERWISVHTSLPKPDYPRGQHLKLPERRDVVRNLLLLVFTKAKVEI